MCVCVQARAHVRVHIRAAAWTALAAAECQLRELVHITASRRLRLHTHQSLHTLKRSHAERNCNLPTMGPDLLAFTSLSGLFVCEVVMVIKFLRVGKKKERQFKGGLVGKRAVGDDTHCAALRIEPLRFP